MNFYFETDLFVPCWNKIAQYLRVKGRHFTKSDSNIQAFFRESFKEHNLAKNAMEYSDSEDETDNPLATNTWLSSDKNVIKAFSNKIKRLVAQELCQDEFYIPPSIISPSNWERDVYILGKK